MSTTAPHSSRQPLPRSILAARVVAAYAPGVTYDAVGQQFGVSRYTVKGILQRARAANRTEDPVREVPPRLPAEVPDDLADIAMRMRPGRRRMLLVLLAAGPDGVTMPDLADAYYADGPKPPQGMKSCGSQVARVRDQIAPLDWVITATRAAGKPGALFVLARKTAVLAEPQPEPTRYTLADALGIKVTSRTIRDSVVSLSRCEGLERVSA